MTLPFGADAGNRLHAWKYPTVVIRRTGRSVGMHSVNKAASSQNVLPAGENVASMRIAEVVPRLEARYGVPKWFPRLHPLDELISCILSQHTSDINSFRAFDRLKAAFPTWESVLDATTEDVEEAIRCGGLAKSKAPQIGRAHV